MDEPTTPVLVAGTIQMSFNFFSRLPAEGQLDIWESAISDLSPYVATMYTTGSLCPPKTPREFFLYYAHAALHGKPH
jgi:hypothetical protein